MKRFACVLSLALAVGLMGCSSNQAEESSSDSAVEPATEEVAEHRTIGQSSDDALEILLTNGLDQNIVELKVTGGEADGLPEVVSGLSEPVAADETVSWRYVADQGNLVDLTVALADGSALTIAGIDVSNIAEMTVCYADGVAYVDYVSASGSKGSTKQAALDAKAQAEAEAAAQAEAEAAAQAQAEAEAAAQQPAYQEPAYQEPAYQEPTYQEPSGGSDQGSGEAPSGPSQEEDQCVDGGVLLR